MAQMKIRDIKTRTKELFTKCWAEAAFITILQTAVFMLYYSVIMLLGRFTGAHSADTLMPEFTSFPPVFILSSAGLLLTGHIVTAPLEFGIKWYYWQASSGLFVPVSSIFGCYSSPDSIKRCIKMRLMIDVRLLALISAAAAFTAAAGYLTSILHGITEKDSIPYIFATAGFWAAVIIILAAVATLSLRYVPLGYIMADDPDATVTEIIARSRKRLGRKYIGMMKMYCSFAVWYLLFIFVFPILPLIPYLKMSTAVFIRSCEEPEDQENTADHGVKRERAAVG